MSNIEELKGLAELKEQGILTEEEFQKEKEKILEDKKQEIHARKLEEEKKKKELEQKLKEEEQLVKEEEKRRKEGLAVDDGTWSKIAEVAQKVGLDPELWENEVLK